MQIKSSDRDRKRKKIRNLSDDEDILNLDEPNSPDADASMPGPDELSFYTFFLEGIDNPPDLLGIEDDQLMQIQNDTWERLKQRDEQRDKKITDKLTELEAKYNFASRELLKYFAQVSELLNPDSRPGPSRVKSADKMVMMPALFDGETPERAKQHYECFKQYIQFQTNHGNIDDSIAEAIELFEQTLDKKALGWFQEHKAEFTDLSTLKRLFLSRYNPWEKTK